MLTCRQVIRTLVCLTHAQTAALSMLAKPDECGSPATGNASEVPPTSAISKMPAHDLRRSRSASPLSLRGRGRQLQSPQKAEHGDPRDGCNNSMHHIQQFRHEIDQKATDGKEPTGDTLNREIKPTLCTASSDSKGTRKRGLGRGAAALTFLGLATLATTAGLMYSDSMGPNPVNGTGNSTALECRLGETGAECITRPGSEPDGFGETGKNGRSRLDTEPVGTWHNLRDGFTKCHEKQMQSLTGYTTDAETRLLGDESKLVELFRDRVKTSKMLIKNDEALKELMAEMKIEEKSGGVPKFEVGIGKVN